MEEKSFIEVHHLSKSFQVRKKREKGHWRGEKETIRALKDVSFSIDQGELVGYIGPNGAGKSTTVKILSGILTPDAGDVRIDGQTPWKDRKEHVKRIGVVFGQRMQLWWDVPILDSYSLLRDIYRLNDADYTKRLHELTEALGLGSLLRTPLRQLSLGQRMRAELCGSLLHRPRILFLDEPTIGLDAVSKLALRDFLKWENETHHTTILLTTHDMEDMAALCSRVMVLGRGQKLYDGSLSALLREHDRTRSVEIRYDTPDCIPSLPSSVRMHREGDTLHLTYAICDLSTSDLLSMLQKAGAIREMTVQPQSIDYLIADMYREMGL